MAERDPIHVLDEAERILREVDEESADPVEAVLRLAACAIPQDHRDAVLELLQASTDYARLIQVERFDRGDIAVARAYERLRLASAAVRTSLQNLVPVPVVRRG